MDHLYIWINWKRERGERDGGVAGTISLPIRKKVIKTWTTHRKLIDEIIDDNSSELETRRTIISELPSSLLLPVDGGSSEKMQEMKMDNLAYFKWKMKNEKWKLDYLHAQL